MRALTHLDSAVKLILVVIFFLPNPAVAQQLHTFKNGEAADAVKVNQNFDALKDQLLLQMHPEGGLQFRYSDEASLILPLAPSMYRKEPDSIMLEQEDGSSWGPIAQSFATPDLYTQKGISFERHLVTRSYPTVAPPDVCPDGTQVALPLEVLQTFVNQYGSITVGTMWDFGEGASPSPATILNNSTGFYLCVGAELQYAGRYGVIGATGRYKCASNSKERFSMVLGKGVTSSSSAQFQLIEGLSDVTFQVTSLGNDPLISADIPATCEETESRSSDTTPQPTIMTVFGVDVEVPPIQ